MKLSIRKKTVLLILALATVTAAAQVHVTTDKSCYVAGDRIWCSVFSSSGPAVAYLELISSDGVAARARIALDEFEIPYRRGLFEIDGHFEFLYDNVCACHVRPPFPPWAPPPGRMEGM